jgi:hypothetical protein
LEDPSCVFGSAPIILTMSGDCSVPRLSSVGGFGCLWVWLVSVCRVRHDLGMAAVTGPMIPKSLRPRALIRGSRNASSASLNRRSKDVRVLPIVIAELEFGNIERHVLAADLVERTNDATLDDRPEAFDGLSMNRANNILAVARQPRSSAFCRTVFDASISSILEMPNAQAHRG